MKNNKLQYDKVLELYELDKENRVGYINWEGQIFQEVPRFPKILFAEIPVIFHLSCNLCIQPLENSSEFTGPNGRFRELVYD